MRLSSCGTIGTAVSPQRASEIEKIALASASTMSQAEAMPVPPPKQPPCTSAIVGLGSAVSAWMARAVRSEMAMFAAALSLLIDCTQARSAPAWKCRPAPRSTITRARSSAARSPRAAASWPIISPS